RGFAATRCATARARCCRGRSLPSPRCRKPRHPRRSDVDQPRSRALGRLPRTRAATREPHARSCRHYGRWPEVVNVGVSRYPARMEPLTVDALRALATLGGLELTDQELAALLPLVTVTRATMDSVRDALSGDVEPATQYRIL